MAEEQTMQPSDPVRGTGGTGAGITGLAVGFPSVVRTNDYWRARYPEIVAQAEQYSLARLWAKSDREGDPFDAAAGDYLADPFRGAKERRIRAPGETALSMELHAARGALEATGYTPDDIDLMLVTSFVADQLGTGNALYLARELGLRAPAWNYETACSGSVVGLHMAATMVKSGLYRRVLVVGSTSNSVTSADDDTLAWFIGDGAGAFVVEPVPEGYGVLGWKTINSIETTNIFVIHSVAQPDGSTRLLTKASQRANAIAREVAEPYLRVCVDGALSAAGMRTSDVDFWLFNTPNAWYADFCAKLLGVEKGRYTSVYERYGNIGAALMPATFYHALHEKRVPPGSVVGIYSIGSTSTSSGVIMRVGDIALGPYPERPGAPGE